MNEPTTAYMTLDEDGSPSMLFFDRQEALNYCNRDELPIELVVRASQTAPSPVDKLDAERWREWLPWMRKLNRKPYDLAMEIDKIDRAIAQQGAQS